MDATEVAEIVNQILEERNCNLENGNGKGKSLSEKAKERAVLTAIVIGIGLVGAFCTVLVKAYSNKIADRWFEEEK